MSDGEDSSPKRGAVPIYGEHYDSYMDQVHIADEELPKSIDSMVMGMLQPLCWKSGAILVNDESNRLVAKYALKLIEYVELVSVEEIAQLVASHSVVSGPSIRFGSSIKTVVPRWREHT